jgi:hypothetical protein
MAATANSNVQFQPLEHHIANTDLKCTVIPLENLWTAFAMEAESTKPNGRSPTVFMSQKRHMA